MTSKLVQNLAEQGIQVRISHLRPHPCFPMGVSRKTVLKEGFLPSDFSPKGGVTKVTLIKDDNIVEAQAVCSPHDPFNKSMGVQIALGRALKLL